MRIDLNPGNGVRETQVAKPELRQESINRTARGPQPAAEFATSVGKLASAALSAPDVREVRVNELRTRIDTENYRVGAHDLASSMLEQLRIVG